MSKESSGARCWTPHPPLTRRPLPGGEVGSRVAVVCEGLDKVDNRPLGLNRFDDLVSAQEGTRTGGLGVEIDDEDVLYSILGEELR